jgi:SOS response regulatory protein OraA/RecX
MKLPPYEVPTTDADLLEAGVVLTPERLVEVWSHNVVARELRDREWQNTLKRQHKELFHRKKRLRVQLATRGYSKEAIKRILEGTR